MRQDIGRTLRLDGGPLYRFALLRISDNRYLGYAVNHHIINDGIGWRLLMQRVGTAYTALLDGRPYSPPETSWRDILADEAIYMNSDHRWRDRAYWLEQLAAPRPRVTLSSKPPMRPAGYALQFVDIVA